MLALVGRALLTLYREEGGSVLVGQGLMDTHMPAGMVLLLTQDMAIRTIA